MSKKKSDFEKFIEIEYSLEDYKFIKYLTEEARDRATGTTEKQLITYLKELGKKTDRNIERLSKLKK